MREWAFSLLHGTSYDGDVGSHLASGYAELHCTSRPYMDSYGKRYTLFKQSDRHTTATVLANG